jgi:hypothetical protein
VADNSMEEEIEKAVAMISGVDFKPTGIGVFGGPTVQDATIEVLTVTGSDMVSGVGMQIVFPDGSGLTFILADPNKVTAQILMSYLRAGADNRSLEKPIDLSSVHARARTTTPHRAQRAPATKSRRGRK